MQLKKSLILYFFIIVLLLIMQFIYFTNMYEKKIKKCKIEFVVGNDMSDITDIITRENYIKQKDIDNIKVRDALNIYLKLNSLRYFAKKDPKIIEEAISVNKNFCENIKNFKIVELIKDTFLKSKLSNKTIYNNIHNTKENINFFIKQCIKVQKNDKQTP